MRTYPAVLNGLFPGLTALTDTDDDVQAIVTGVETLSVSLRAVADKSEGIVLEVVLELGKGPVASLIDNLLGASEVQSLDTTNGSLHRVLAHVVRIFVRLAFT